MLEWLIPLLGSIPGFVGMFQDPYRKTQQPTNINPYTDQTWNTLREQGSNFNNLWQQSLADSRTAGMSDFGQSRNLLSGLQNINYDPMAAQRQFMSETPGLQSLARRTVEGESDTEQALAQMRAMAGSEAASRFGGSPTGSAMMQSVMRASMEPEFAFRQNRDQMTTGLAGQLMGQRMGNLEQGMLNSANFDMNRSLQGAQGFMGLGGVAQQSELARLGQLAQLLSQNSGLQAQMGQANMWSPNMVNNPNYVSPTQNINNLGDLFATGTQMQQWWNNRQGPPAAPTQVSFSGGR